MVATCKGNALTGLWFVGQRHFPENLSKIEEGDCLVFDQTKVWLEAYFAKKPLPPLPDVAPQGTAFQQAVWAQLQTIPYGQTTTYGAIAKAIGKPKGAQAIGGAVGHNPISILIPCHRVLGADGSLTGYAGGLERKMALLELEGHIRPLYFRMPCLFFA